MRRSGVAVALYLLLVFGSGALVGAFGYWLYVSKTVSAKSRPRTPEEYRRRYIEEMNTRLKLNADQLQRLNAILDETGAKYRALHARSKPEMDSIQQWQVGAVRAILDDAQRREYEKMRQERMKRSKKHAPGR